MQKKWHSSLDKEKRRGILFTQRAGVPFRLPRPDTFTRALEKFLAWENLDMKVKLYKVLHFLRLDAIILKLLGKLAAELSKWHTAFDRFCRCFLDCCEVATDCLSENCE